MSDPFSTFLSVLSLSNFSPFVFTSKDGKDNKFYTILRFSVLHMHFLTYFFQRICKPESGRLLPNVIQEVTRAILLLVLDNVEKLKRSC